MGRPLMRSYPPTRSSPPAWLVPLIVAVGICLRFIQWLWDKSYFHDEICLLWNIRGRSFAQYLGPLDRNQAAPPLFMQIEKMVCLLLKSDSERIMRMPALIASCVTTVWFVYLARRILRPWEVALAVCLLACSEKMSYFAAMLKPYALDVLVAAALMWMAVEVDRTRSIARWLVLCAAAAMAVWLSYPAILVFAGVSAALSVRFLGRNPRRMAFYIIGNVAVAVPFFLLMHFVESAQHTDLMNEYWGNNFADLSKPARIPMWYVTALYKWCNYEMKWGGLYLLPLAAVGLIATIRNRRRALAAIVVGPLVMHLLAATLHHYPFEGRLTLYLIVPIFLLAAGGAGVIYDLLVPGSKSASIAAAVFPGGLLALAAAGLAVHNVIRPYVFSDYRPLVQVVRTRAEEGDVVYSPYTVEFQYYWPEIGDRVRGGVPYADRIPSRRFWLVWSHPRPEDLRDLAAMRRWAATFAAERGSYVAGENYAYVYEITSRPPHTRWR